MYKICISGKSGSGKDTASKLFRQELDCIDGLENIHTISFAKPIKQIAKILYPDIPDEYLYGESKYRDKCIKNTDNNDRLLTIRDLLIDIGERYKQFDPLIWIKRFNDNLNLLKNADVIMATDVRFSEEFAYLSANNFYKIRIKRDTIVKSKNITEISQDAIPDNQFDFIVDNNSDLDSLRNKIKLIVSQIIV